MGKKRQDNSSKFRVLPKSAGLKQHTVYMEKHTGAIRRSLRVDLGSSWCLGYELTRIKAKLGFKGEKWDAHCVKVVGKTSRQARDYMVLAKAYSSAEEMIEDVGETVSFATAVVTARALVNPDPTPEPKPGKKGTDGDDGPARIKPTDGGTDDGLTTVVCPTRTPDSKGPGMLDDIIRIAVQFTDDLTLLGKVHAILVKAEAEATREVAKGNERSKTKAKSRKPAAKKKKKKKRGKSA